MEAMRRVLGIAVGALLASHAAPISARTPPLRDPVFMRIGIMCRWDSGCVTRQRNAMIAALSFVERKSPPPARIHACNRNASRKHDRVDWVGFNNCIRNKKMGR